MSRWLALLGFAICMTASGHSPARAQDDDTPYRQRPKKQILRACTTEMKQYCPQTADSVTDQLACLRQYNVDLSLVCRHAISRLSVSPGRAG